MISLGVFRTGLTRQMREEKAKIRNIKNLYSKYRKQTIILTGIYTHWGKRFDNGKRMSVVTSIPD
jgi:hypothetical protein